MWMTKRRISFVSVECLKNSIFIRPVKYKSNIYLTSFIDSLDLKNITLVMTDIGGILGQKYASQHPENIKAMIFMETPFADAETFYKNGGIMQRMMF